MRILSRLLRMFSGGRRRGHTPTHRRGGMGTRTTGGGLMSMVRRFMRR